MSLRFLGNIGDRMFFWRQEYDYESHIIMLQIRGAMRTEEEEEEEVRAGHCAEILSLVIVRCRVLGGLNFRSSKKGSRTPQSKTVKHGSLDEISSVKAA